MGCMTIKRKDNILYARTIRTRIIKTKYIQQ